MVLKEFSADLYSPLVTWDVTRRDITAKMNAQECFAMAKRSTINLRNMSPEIVRCLSTIPATRQRFAKLHFTRHLIKNDLLDKNEVTQYKRMSRIIDSQLKSNIVTLERFQKESGYRVCCLLDYVKTPSAHTTLSDLKTLNRYQYSLDQANLIDEVLQVSIKRGSKYPEVNSAAHIMELTKKLSLHTTKIIDGINSIKSELSGLSVPEYLQDQLATQPQIKDDVLSARILFSTVRECFGQLNQTLSNELAALVNPVATDHDDLRLKVL